MKDIAFTVFCMLCGVFIGFMATVTTAWSWREEAHRWQLEAVDAQHAAAQCLLLSQGRK